MNGDDLNISDYMKGVLFGDGKLLTNHSRYLFSTTRINLKNKVEVFLKENKIDYYSRKFEFFGDKENYEDMYKIFIDKDLYHRYLKKQELDLESNLSYEFLLGYIETKGSFFQYTEKKDNYTMERWRLSLSGENEVLSLIKNFFERDSLHFTNLVHRRERAEKGIISKSYRLNLNRRNDLKYLVEKLIQFDCTAHLKSLFHDFIEFDNCNPRNKAKNYYKNYRMACSYLMKELNIEYRGSKTENIKGTYIKKIYRFENGEAKEYEKGWEGVYKTLLKEYEKRYKIPGPKILL